MISIIKIFIILIIFNNNLISSFKLITRKNFIISSPYLLNYKEYPITVIGGSGLLGTECIKQLVNNKINVRSVSRNPQKINNINNNYIEYIKADVNDKDKLKDIINNSKGVIFTINPKNENYIDVCVNGLLNVASLCILYNIPRLIIISASCISCNNNINKIDKICGLNCDHCKAKQEGELLIRNLYKNTNNNAGYTIIRSGLLTSGIKKGVDKIEINQDFTKSGLISRIDLADLCINSLQNENTKNTIFEAYYKDTIQPVNIKNSLSLCINSGNTIEECFFGGYYKNRKPKDLEEVMKVPLIDTLFKTGNEMSGKTWNELFKNLKKDINIYNSEYN